MGHRDFRGSLKQFNLLPPDPEEERQARIDLIIAESMAMAGLENDSMSYSGSEPAEEWTVIYDKFQIPRR